MNLKFLNVLKEEDHRRALLATLVYMMIATLFFLLVSMDEPDPPIVEKVIPIEIPVDMENLEIPEEILEDLGGGGSQGGASSDPSTSDNSAPMNHVQEDPSVPEPGGNEDGDENEVNNPDPQPDYGLGFNGDGGGIENGNGEGDGFGDGDGVGDGDGSNGDGVYNGSRKVSSPPVFNGNAGEEGKIALEIWVDENGHVVKTRYLQSKSTSGDDYLIKLATKAAKSMKYEKKPGAGIEKVQYQVFEFKKI